MKVIYSKYNRNRRPSFQIETTILLHDNAKVVRKKPLYPVAQPHIDAIYEHSVKLSSSYRNIHVLVPEVVGQSLHFPFVEGETWERRLVEKLNTRDMNGFIKLLHEFYGMLTSLQDNRTVPFESTPQFIEIFGTTLTMKDAHYLEPANIDIVCDNVVVDEHGNNVMLDCEWVFPFPVPVTFIMWRSLYALWVKHQNRIRSYCGFEDMCAWFDISPEMLSQFTLMEEHYFQVYVHGAGASTRWDRYLKKNTSTENIQRMLGENEFAVKVFLPLNRVYTYVQSQSARMDGDYQELTFTFADPFDDHIRIDALNVAGYVEIKDITIRRFDENGRLEQVGQENANTGFINLTFSDDVVPIEVSGVFGFLALSGSTHLFMKVPEPITGRFQVSIVIKATNRVTPAYADTLLAMKEGRILYDQRSSQLTSEHAKLQILVKQQEAVLRQLRREMDLVRPKSWEWPAIARRLSKVLRRK